MLFWIETLLLCLIFFGICYLGTGSDDKNIKSFSSYPDEVQEIIKQRPSLSAKIKNISPLVTFVSNILMFVFIFLIFGFFIRDKSFLHNFLSLLIMGQILNLFDFLVIDVIWWQHSKRIRFTGTENTPRIYLGVKKHFYSFLKALIMFTLVALIDGFILTLF